MTDYYELMKQVVDEEAKDAEGVKDFGFFTKCILSNIFFILHKKALDMGIAEDTPEGFAEVITEVIMQAMEVCIEAKCKQEREQGIATEK